MPASSPKRRSARSFLLKRCRAHLHAWQIDPLAIGDPSAAHDLADRILIVLADHAKFEAAIGQKNSVPRTSHP